MADENRDPASWDAKFNAEMRQRPDQKFAQLMLCDVKKVSSNHLDHVSKIVFSNPLSAKHWHDYIMYMMARMQIEKFPKRKEQIARLLQFALDFLGDRVEKEESYAVRLHLLKASLASEQEDALRHYEHMWTEKIGRKSAQFYLVWADLEVRRGRNDKAKSIINNGMKQHALPAAKLSQKLADLEGLDAVDVAEVEEAVPEVSARRKSLRSRHAASNDPKKNCLVIGEDASDTSSDDKTTAIERNDTKEPAKENEISSRSKLTRSAAGSSALGKSVRVPAFPSRDFQSKKGHAAVAKQQVVIGDSGEESCSDDTAEDTLGAGTGQAATTRRSLRSAAPNEGAGDDDVSTDELTRSSRLLGKAAGKEPENSNPCDESVVVFKKHTSTRGAKQQEQMVLDVEDGDDSTVEKTVKVRRRSTRGLKAADTTGSEATASKANLKKYVDDKLLNFDPLNFHASRAAAVKSNASKAVAPSKSTFVIPDAVANKRISTDSKKSDTSFVDNLDESVMDETICADTVRMTPGKPTGGRGSSGANDDVIEFSTRSRVPASRKRSLRSSNAGAGGDSSDENTGLGDLLGADESSPVSVSKRRSNKNPRLSKPAKSDPIDKEPMAPPASKSVRIATTGSTDNVMAVVASSTKRRLPSTSCNAGSDENRHGGKRGREAESLAQGSFSGASSLTSLLADPNRVVMLNGKQYLRLNVLGKGGSSCVYLVLSDSGALYAYKRVEVHGSDESADSVLDSYVNEIKLLNSLKGSSHIIQLIDSAVSREEMSIAMVLEAGDIDLARVLSRGHYGFTNKGKEGGKHSSSSISNPFFLRTVWGEMLEAVDYIHDNRIVHGDLKPANFVFVRGHLKLIDFGIAKAMSNDTTNIYRDSQVGTINYMAPEAISPMVDCGSTDVDVSFGDSDEKRKLKMRLGRPSDIWSLGCILYQMLYGKTPFSALNTIQKLHAIPNPKYEILFPTHLNTESGSCSTPSSQEIESAISKGTPFFKIDTDGVQSVKSCLIRELTQRASIRGENGLLNHPFLDLEAAREKWSGTGNETVAVEKIKSRSCKLLDIRQSLVDTLGGSTGGSVGKLNDEEIQACTDIANTAQRVLPTSISSETASVAPRRSSRSTPLGHRGASPVIGASATSSVRTAAATMYGASSQKILPRGLKDQIQGGDVVRPAAGYCNDENVENAGPATRHKLQKISQSKANKWVRPHITPEKNDMRSVLDKKFGQLRKFLGNEDDEDNDDSTAWQDSGPIDEFSLKQL